MIPAKNRERKCSTCKHYQPSPLWRKGWCRNPLLYDRNTNHLVEADSLACNRTFIDYWEPIEGPVPKAGPQARTGKPRIAPSIPMDTVDAKGNRGTVTGNTNPGIAAARPLSKPGAGRERPPLSLVTPDFEEDEEDLQDTAKITRQIEQVPGPEGEEEVAITTRQRIQRARAARRKNLFGLSQTQLMIAGGVAALLLVVALAAFILGRPSAGTQGNPGAQPSALASSVPATPTGFGDPTATVPAVANPSPTTGAAPPTDIIAVGGWVQVNSRDGLRLRDEPGTSGQRLTVLRNGTKARVVDGPREVDGLTWWKVDQFNANAPEASGWCAADFLVPTTAPTP